jgi:hypothetical protein
MKKIDKIIEIIRENMMVSTSIPTNNISTGHIAKFDPVITFKKRKNGSVDGRSVSDKYKKWLRSLKFMT